MKFFSTFWCIIAVVTAELKISPEEIECRDKTGASDEDVRMFRSMEQPVERTTKCYYDCVLQAMGYSDGKRFNREGFLKLAMQSAKTHNQRDTMRQLANQCDGIENDDPCELAADILDCLFSRN